MTQDLTPSATAPEESPEASPPPRPQTGRVILKYSGYLALGVVLFLTTAWATLAVYYTDLNGGRSPRALLALLFLAASLGAIVLIKPRRRGFAACLGLFLVVLGWFLLVPKPSNDREWLPGVAQVPTATIDGDRLTVYNVRNFDYRSATDSTPRWEQRSYDLSKVRRVDFMLCYWGSRAIAHAMVSFGFEGEEYLAVSIETRKEKAEAYSTVQGFFRQYELIYVFADERDVVRLRTNFKNEDVYLYRSALTPEQAREVLLSYLGTANALAAHPEFYNALTSNCATNVVTHARHQNPAARLSWEIVLSGYAARVAHRNGRLDSRLSFEDLRARSRINDAALAAEADVDFSSSIRRGLPDPLMPVSAGLISSPGR